MSNAARLRQRADEKSFSVSKKRLIILRKMPGMEKSWTPKNLRVKQNLTKSCGNKELEQVRQTMEKESAEEKEDFEMRVRNEYNEIIKAKDELIRVLTEEKDFFRNELCDLRRSFDLFTRHVHRDAFHHRAMQFLVNRAKHKEV